MSFRNLPITSRTINEGDYPDRYRRGIVPKPLPRDGNMVWRVSSKPSIEPVTLTEQKVFTRIDGTDEDTLLTNFIKAVRENVEDYLGRSLLQQTIVATMDFWPVSPIRLPRPPIMSFLEVVTLDQDDNPTVYSADNYYVQAHSGFERAELILRQGVAGPVNSIRDYGGYQLSYIAGYGADRSDVPEGIRQAIMLWVSTAYETRVVTPDPPVNVLNQLRFYKRMKT
jgi:uncharacterized phiE125 gp8 family phage protein